jgi:hypothetical protein
METPSASIPQESRSRLGEGRNIGLSGRDQRRHADRRRWHGKVQRSSSDRHPDSQRGRSQFLYSGRRKYLVEEPVAGWARTRVPNPRSKPTLSFP